MDAIKAVETLLWKKEELKNLDYWLDDLELNNRPVNGIHWRKLRKLIDGLAYEMATEIGELDAKIKEAIGEIDIDITTK